MASRRGRLIRSNAMTLIRDHYCNAIGERVVD